MPKSNAGVVSKLNDLIELDHDAIEAYQAAIKRLESTEYRDQLEKFCGDHRRHTQNLPPLVTRLGGTPAKGPDMQRFLTKGAVVISGIAGGDHAVLLAMRANEEITTKRYELALKADGMDEDVRKTVRANYEDEIRHRDWLVQTLHEMKEESSTS